MISHLKKQQGLSLLEVLIAILLINITILGFMSIESRVLTELKSASKQLLAEQIAFELLDLYLDVTSIVLPANWHYAVSNVVRTENCNLIQITIKPFLGNPITQERLKCD